MLKQVEIEVSFINSDCVYHVISMKLKMNFILLLCCPLYNQMRRVFLPNVDMKTAFIDTFYNLFNHSEQEILRLAKYT